MKYKTISKSEDFEKIIQDSIRPTHINDLEYHNMWAMGFDNNYIKKIDLGHLEEYISKILENRQKQLQQLNLPAIFYLWLDEQALQLRFNILTGTDTSLPFGSKIHKLNSVTPILKEFLTTAQIIAKDGDEVEFFTPSELPDDDDEKEYVLDVYIKEINQNPNVQSQRWDAMSKHMNISLTSLQAFNAMTKFLEDYYKKSLADDIGALLGEMQFVEGNRTADPVIWGDWLESSENKQSLSQLEAFNAMKKFLKKYGNSISSQEIKSLLDTLQPSDNSTINQAISDNWTKCVNEAMNEPKGSRSYLKLYK